jgi:hypothetical protein
MKDSLYLAGEELKEAITDFIIPLQTTRKIDEYLFEKLHEASLQLVRVCKNEPEVPKALLQELQGTARILANEAVYLKNNEKEMLEDMAKKISLCLDLILLNEVPEDRVSGVPRII